jgi:hypothetical protein
MNRENFKLVSFKEDGLPLQSVNEVPAFYSLTYNGHLVDYFTSIEAAKIAMEECIVCMQELETTEEIEYCIPEFYLEAA